MAEKKDQLPIVRQQKGRTIEPSTSNALAVYDKHEVKVQKQGIFRNSKRKTGPSRGQLMELLLENIEAFSEYEARLLRSIFDLNIMTAQEVMIPLSEITPLTIGAPTTEVLKHCCSFNYRYIPIYSERIDWLIGIVDAMEVFTSEGEAHDLSSFVREVYYTPALKSAIDLLDELRQAEVPAAIVVNEYSSCIGVVEMIDILEKIIGETTANRKRDTPHIEKLGRNDWRIDGRMLIADVNTALETQIPTDRCDTLGGFILVLLGRLPQKGETIEYEDFEFNIDVVLKYGISYIRATKKTKS